MFLNKHPMTKRNEFMKYRFRKRDYNEKRDFRRGDRLPA